VKKTFADQVQILKGIGIEIEEGEFLILVGPSGCGKSTLLSMIAGLDAPTSGRIHIGDRDVTDLPSKDRDIAMVFQSYALYPNMNVAQNIAFGMEMRKVPKPQREATVQRVAAMLQLGDLLDRKPGQLSGGQRQRVAMGRALARDPKLRVEMRAEIKLLHQRTKTTTVYVTHDQVKAMTLGDRIAVMKEGAVQQFGTPDDIYTRPATRFVAEFIGSPSMNMIAAHPSAVGLAAEGIDLPLTELQRAALRAAGNPAVAYGLRPEDLGLADTGLPGHFTIIEPTGPETYATLQTPLGSITVRVPGALRASVGDAVCLQWSPEKAHLFDAQSGLRLA